MSKTLTRKSLALGTIVALGFSALTGIAPAQAADLVTLVPNVGTSYNVPVKQSFTLKTYFAASAQAATSDALRVKIVDSTDSLKIGANGTEINSTTTVTRDASTHAINVSVSQTPGVAASETFVLVPAANVTDSFSVTVQTWVDSDGDTLPNDANVSAVRTVKFLKAADIKATLDLAEVAFGEDSAGATVTVSPDLNLEQTKSAGATAIAAGDSLSTLSNSIVVNFGSDAAGSYTYVSENKFKAENTNLTGSGLAAGDFTVKAVMTDNAATGAADVTLGSTTKALVDHAVSATASRVLGTESADLTQAAGTTAAVVRVGSTTHTAVVTVKNASDVAVGAGVLVRGTITGTLARGVSATATDTVSVRGVLVGATTPTFTALTDANGKVSLPIVATGGTATTEAIVTFTAEGKTLPAIKVTWTAATYTASIVENVAGYATYGVSRKVGSTTPVSVTVVDQWEQPIAAGYDARLIIGTVGTATTKRTTAPTNEYASALSAGKASFSYVDNGAGATTTGDVYRVQIAKKLGNGNYDVAVATSEAIRFIYTAAASTPTATISGTSLQSVTGDAARQTTSGAVRSAGDKGVFDSTSTGGVAISVATGVAGESVTLSGAGLGFKATGGTDVYKVGSITVNANESGNVTVTVLSQLAGKHVITVKSGTATSYLEATFNAAVGTAGTLVTFTSPTSLLAKKGRTLTFTGVLSDKYGNPVEATGTLFRAVYDGPGLEVTDDVVKTDSYGKFSVKVLAGSDDSGLATVTVEYGGATDATTDDYTTSKTVLVGASASVSAGSKKANVVVKGAEGLSVKVVSGSKVTTKTATSDSFKLSLSKLTKGSKTVKVYVNNILVVSKKVSIK